MSEHVHGEDCVPETCFREKLRYMRHNGMNVSWSYSGGGGKADFHNLLSVGQRERNHVAELKANGVAFERA